MVVPTATVTVTAGPSFRVARQLSMIAFDRDKIGGLPSTQDLPVRR
jgi:hypothetical protein